MGMLSEIYEELVFYFSNPSIRVEKIPDNPKYPHLINKYQDLINYMYDTYQAYIVARFYHGRISYCTISCLNSKLSWKLKASDVYDEHGNVSIPLKGSVFPDLESALDGLSRFREFLEG